ncbi:MAG: SWIM zinc finger domain-containing protein, partial [Runella sp.]
MFTLQDIQNLANSTSFERGKSYFKNGYVRNLKFKNNSFEAKVHGSERYDVSISLDKHGNIESTYCDCPYDYDGDCKHIVAVGLAAIEYMKAKAIELTQTVAYERVEPPAASFDKAYAQASDADKLVYLNQLLQKNIDLQQAFLQFISAKNPQQQATLKQNAIDQIACDVYESLSDLMFNEDTFADYAQDRDYGYHYDENYGEDEMEAMVTEVLEPYQKRIEIYMQEGRLVDAFSTWLGVYEGILAAT